MLLASSCEDTMRLALGLSFAALVLMIWSLIAYYRSK